MNPLVIVRGIAGVALPTALGVTYFKKRRSSHPDEDPGSEDLDEHSESTKRWHSQSLQAFVDHAGHLRDADLRHVHVSGVSLAGVDLSDANLSHASLVGCDLSSSYLDGARLDHANLDRSDLRRADFGSASLLETSFWKADLRGANLSGCLHIVMANLRGAQFDFRTRWPAGFDPQAAGAHLQTPEQ